MPRLPLRDALVVVIAGVSQALSLWLFPAWTFGKYPALATAVREGRLRPEQVADASPGYLLLNLVLPPTGVRALQGALALAGILLAFRLGARVGGRLAGWVAAVALASCSSWLAYPAVLEPDLAIGVLTLAAVHWLDVTRPSNPELTGTLHIRAAVLSGAALGLSFTLRPTAALFAALALAWILFAARRAASGVNRSRSAGAFVAAFAGIAVLVFAGLRLHAGWDLGATMSAGQVFHQGHRPESAGVGATYPTLLSLVALGPTEAPQLPDPHHQAYRDLAAAAAGGPISAAEAERFWIGKALAFARTEPVSFTRQLLRKLVFVLAPPSHEADIKPIQEAVEAAPFAGIPSGWLAIAGVAGLLIGWRGGRRLALLAGWVLGAIGLFTVMYYTTRYGLVVLPAFAVLAGVAVAEIVAARRDRVRLGFAALAVSLPCLALVPRWVRDEARLLERIALVPGESKASALRALGRWEEAREHFLDEQSALPDVVWPWSPHGYALGADTPEVALAAAERSRARFGDERPADAFLLASLYAAADRCDLALPLARRAASVGFHGALADTSLDPDLLESDCLVELGDRPGALTAVFRSLGRWPGTLDGLARAQAALEAQPGPEPADLARVRAQLLSLHDPASVSYALARAHRRWGAPLRAVDDAAWLQARLPAAAPLAAFERALALLDLGREDEALRAYAGALTLRFAMHGARRFDEPIRRRLAASPEDPVALRMAFVHFSARGELGDLRALLRRHPELAGPAR